MANNMILAADASGLTDVLSTSGFHRLRHDTAITHLAEAGLWLGPRNDLEQREIFRQIIPYIVLRVGNQIVSYTRTTAGGEGRLHGKVSIGVGGHVDFSDVARQGEEIELRKTLETAAHREVNEEIGGVQIDCQSWIGTIVDNETAVGRVHIGVVGLWTLNASPSGTIEDAISGVALRTIDELLDEVDRMETWSAMILPALRDIVE